MSGTKIGSEAGNSKEWLLRWIRGVSDIQTGCKPENLKLDEIEGSLPSNANLPCCSTSPWAFTPPLQAVGLKDLPCECKHATVGVPSPHRLARSPFGPLLGPTIVGRLVLCWCTTSPGGRPSTTSQHGLTMQRHTPVLRWSSCWLVTNGRSCVSVWFTPRSMPCSPRGVRSASGLGEGGDNCLSNWPAKWLDIDIRVTDYGSTLNVWCVL